MIEGHRVIHEDVISPKKFSSGSTPSTPSSELARSNNNSSNSNSSSGINRAKTADNPPRFSLRVDIRDNESSTPSAEEVMDRYSYPYELGFVISA